VVKRDKAGEGLLTHCDERMEKLIEFREKLQFFRDPANGNCDTRRMSGNQRPGPLMISAPFSSVGAGIIAQGLPRAALMTNMRKLQDSECLRPRPFLRWAGGKQKLVKHLLPFLPPPNAFRRYFENFLGAGAVFFATGPIAAVLGDINRELMTCYEQVAIDSDRVHGIVQQLARHDSRRFFNFTRSLVPDRLIPAERAARFIYLNKAAFNGIYRVNRQGQFNVPYGPSFKGPAIPSRDHLRAAAKALETAKLVVGDFEETVKSAKEGDFVYMDPPYPPRSRTAFFNHYCHQGFGWEHQLRVAEVFEQLAKRGCLVMLSNAGQRKVYELYRKFQIHRLNVVRWVGSNGDRSRVREIVVTNYDVAGVQKA
jgi:DNA adenine methylase